MGDEMGLKNNHKAALILGGIAGSEGAWLAANLYFNSPSRFLRFCGFQSSAGPLAWIVALGIATAYVGFAARRLPSVREHMFALDGLKLLAVAVAISAGFCEEAVFRKFLMDFCLRLGWPGIAQIAISGLAFGSAHAVWGLFQEHWRAAVGAMIATGTLGLLFAGLYLLGGRNLAPCITSHFLINLLLEPGLVLAAVRGEMGRSPRNA